MGSTTSDFYESQKDKSRIKSYIVTESRGSTAASATWVSPTDRWALGSEGGGATQWAGFFLPGSNLCSTISLHR